MSAESSSPDARPVSLSEAAIRIVSPVLDEAAALPGLLAELVTQGLLEATTFVDNGSTDGSQALIEAAGARLLRESRRGYGYPCLAGLRAAGADVKASRSAAAVVDAAGAVSAEGTDAVAAVVVFMEADGSDDPAEVRRLVQPVLEGTADLVIGSRRAALHRDGGMPLHQRFGNRLASAALRALFGLRIADNGPFRAARLDLLEHLHMEPHAYAWTTEMTAKAHLAGARITVVETAYRPRDGSSKIAGTLRGTLGAFAGIFGTMLRLRLRSAAAFGRRR